MGEWHHKNVNVMKINNCIQCVNVCTKQENQEDYARFSWNNMNWIDQEKETWAAEWQIHGDLCLQSLKCNGKKYLSYKAYPTM